MNNQEFKSILSIALERTERCLEERPDLMPLVSVRNQLNYLIQLCNGDLDGSRLKDLNVGLVAVREIEHWDDTLAGLLHTISAEVEKRHD